MRSSRPLQWSRVVAAFVAILPCAAGAQDEDDSSRLSTPRDSSPLDEVIVTATRREANVQSVPLSVHGVTDDELARLGAVGFADYALTVPGLSFTQGSDGEKQTIRGVSTDQWFEVSPATAVYLDEVPMTSMGGQVGPPYNPDPMLVDVARVEVLNGPQGTLFGSSAMGGAIRIITNQPNLSDKEAFVDSRISSTNGGEFGYGLNGMLNVPLNDGRAALRGVLYQTDVGGYIDNLANGQDDVNNKDITGARLSGAFHLSDAMSLTARVVYQDTRTDGSTREEPIDGPRNQTRLPEPRRDEWANYNVVLNVDLDWGTLLASTSFLDRTNDLKGDVSAFVDFFFGFSNPLTVVNNWGVDEAVQEVRIVSSGDHRLGWLAGLFYQDQAQDINQDFPSPGFDNLTGGLASMFGDPDNLFVRREEFELQQIALYGEVSYSFTDRLDFAVGGRWFEIEQNFSADNYGLLFIRGETLESGSTAESGVTPKFSLSYTRSDNLTFYGTAAEGFRPGGPNRPATDPACLAELATLGLLGVPRGYDSDSLWSYELGLKARGRTGRIQLSAALYHTDWSGMQTDKFLRCGISFTENAGAADIDGAEIKIQMHPGDRFDVILAASFTDGRLIEDVPNLAARAGDRVPGVPRLTTHVGLTYHFVAFGGRDAFLLANHQYVGNSYNDFNAATSLELPSYSITNLRFGVDTERWTGALFVNNVLDERGVLFVQRNVLGTTEAATRPRMAGLSATWRF